MFSSSSLQAGGSVLAANLALKHGWAINVGGGFHHASCMFFVIVKRPDTKLALWDCTAPYNFRFRRRRILFLCRYHHGNLRFVRQKSDNQRDCC
ncbi:hypothetical protein L5515_008026 [Caenorhabditis briggsae]|uniref:Uncharacterized protein n=1 Tax=Caenorhabditis briggsae TaxID=6238 RepID=A0AAE9JN13_CAEBR|nr:hypothetical protein L5515_008026 [Caenorhabditis briggsae]